MKYLYHAATLLAVSFYLIMVIPTAIADNKTNLSAVRNTDENINIMSDVPLLLPVSKAAEFTDNQITPTGRTGSVPFYPQAPLGSWDDPRLENGCEETVVLMAYSWVTGNALSSAQAEDTILSMAEYEKKYFGEFRDTSAADTERLISEFYGYTATILKRDIDVGDIIDAIMAGSVVILPVNGRELNNPYFSSPGPENHMILIIGYDMNEDAFIAHDPGTRFGAGYRYSYATIAKAMRDYPTGSHETYTSKTTAMIIVNKNK